MRQLIGRGCGGGERVYVADITFRCFPNVLCVLAIFIKSKQHAWDILKKGGTISVFGGTPDFEKVKTAMVFFCKNGENGKSQAGNCKHKGGVFLKIFRKTPYLDMCGFLRLEKRRFSATSSRQVNSKLTAK